MVEAKSEESIIYEEEMGEKKVEFMYGGGCNFCANTGYMGRTAIFEVMTVTESIRRMILTSSSVNMIDAIDMMTPTVPPIS